MALASGTQLGAYEIAGALGAGGMGEVYRATDTKLGREVAIKTLPASLADDKDRLARFEREARLLATLNHAHIAAVHNLDEQDGTLYIAMELVEGETLEERLRKGALPVEDALQLALQIALALEAAHDRGVVHRDLKPANVMITPDGVIKVLDFGLAKAFSDDPNDASPAHSPALSLAMTQQGLVLGTAGYMSPEQASGQATDQRADIWSFGVVVYEMLTGMPVFSGESVPHILAAVLKSDPDWERLPANLNPLVPKLLERCLAKKPRNRWHSMADVRIELEGILSDPQGLAARVTMAKSVTRRSASYVSVALALGSLALGALLGALVFRFSNPPASDEMVANFTVSPPEDVPLNHAIWQIPFAIAPNGADLAFIGGAGRDQQLYIRPLAASDADARPIPGTQGAANPVWSPDSEWVAFFVGRSLKRVRVAAGAPTVETITDNTGVGTYWGSREWGSNGQLIVGNEILVAIDADDGGVEQLYGVADVDGAKSLRWPTLIGDSDRFLFVAEGEPATLYLGSLSGDSPRAMMTFSSSYGSTLDYAAGRVFYVDDGILWAQNLDEGTFEFDGERERVLEGIPVSPFGSAPFSVSAAGVLAYRTLPLTEAVEFRWYERDGTPGETVGEPVYIDGFDLSPDGARLAYGRVMDDGAVELWLQDIGSGSPRPLRRGTLETVPRFASDGEGVVITTRREGNPDTPVVLRTIPIDGEAETVVAQNSTNSIPQFWDADADRVVYARSVLDWDLVAKNRSDDTETTFPLNTPSNETFAALSPNGQIMAYITDESGQNTLWIARYPEGRRMQQVSTGMAGEPSWSDDGTELYYFAEERMLMSVSVETDGSGDVVVGMPKPLFRLDDAIESVTVGEVVRRVLAVGPGPRFLVATRAPREREPMQVLLGWDRLLAERESE